MNGPSAWRPRTNKASNVRFGMAFFAFSSDKVAGK